MLVFYSSFSALRGYLWAADVSSHKASTISPLRQARTRHMLGRSRVLLYTLSALTPQRARPVRSASSLLNRFAWYCAGARWRGFHQRYPQVSTKPLILLLKEHHSRHSQEVKTDPLRKCHDLLFRAFSSHFRTASRFDLASNCFSTPIILLDHFIRVNTPPPRNSHHRNCPYVISKIVPLNTLGDIPQDRIKRITSPFLISKSQSTVRFHHPQ